VSRPAIAQNSAMRIATQTSARPPVGKVAADGDKSSLANFRRSPSAVALTSIGHCLLLRGGRAPSLCRAGAELSHHYRCWRAAFDAAYRLELKLAREGLCCTMPLRTSDWGIIRSIQRMPRKALEC
jgi:hypothetical protein